MILMRDYALTHLSDATLLRELSALVARDRLTTAELLAHIAEVDRRRLYAPAGYSSMFAYCVEELRLSEDAAAKRIQAARAARRFPGLFEALAEGRLHLAAVCLLAPHLTSENVAELIEAATDRRKSEVESLLARRFPVLGAPTPERAIVRAIPAHAPGHVQCSSEVSGSELFSDRDGAQGNDRVRPEGAAGIPPGAAVAAEQAGTGGGKVAAERTDKSPAAPMPERYLVQVTIPKSTHDLLRQAQALLSHSVRLEMSRRCSKGHSRRSSSSSRSRSSVRPVPSARMAVRARGR
jgi:hypothetical protein